jgi:glycosyltransferase involved in cell wall biosynthesis
MLETLISLHNEYYISHDHANFWKNIEDPELAQIFKYDVERRAQRFLSTQAQIAARIAELEERKEKALKKKSPKKIRISGAMILKNEEEFIETALLSIYDVCDEICILDTGSTDKTVEIVSKYPKVKLQQKEIVPFDFSIARNMNFNMCSGEAIFVLDGDEMLMNELSEPIENYYIYSATITEFIRKKPFYRWNQPRIFPKNKIIWKSHVHNVPELQDETIQVYCEANDISIYHFKDLKKREDNSRNERNTYFIGRINDKEPDSFRKFYFLTRLHLANGENELAIKNGEKAFDRYKYLKWNQMLYYRDFLMMYVRALYIKRKFSLALEPLYLHANLRGLTSDSCFFNYAFATSQEDHPLAMQYLEKYFDLIKDEMHDPYFRNETLQYHDQILLMRDIYRYWQKCLRM